MSALISVIPIVLLIVLMMGFKVSGYKSALITLVVTILLALFAAPAMGILPEKYAGASIYGITLWSVIEGFLKACFPIILIIICAIFSYNILCETKEIETIKTQFIQMTSDKGLLVLLLTWGLGGVLEGMAGFGTAVAIPAAILIGLGFKPMFSAVICLIANTVAVGFGAVGLPATTLANQVAAEGVASPEMLCEVATFIIIQLALMFFITPFVILMMTDRKKIVKNLSLALFVGTFSIIVQFCCAHFIGPETPAILGSVAAIIAMLIYNKLFIREEDASDEVKVEKKYLEKDLEIIRKLYYVGIPATLNMALSSVLIVVLNAILAVFSQSYVLVLGIYYKLQTFLYLPANGIVQGMRPLIGFNYGAGEQKRVREIYRLVLVMCCGIMAVGMIFCILIPEKLIGLFATTESTIRIGEKALRIICMGFVVSSLSVTVSGALEGIGKGLPSLVISLCRYVIVIIPVAFVLSRFWGDVGVWIAFPITEVVSAGVSFYEKKNNL